MKNLFRTPAALTALAIVLASATGSALAQNKGVDDPQRTAVRAAMNGKTVAFLPVAMAVDLAQGWAKGLKSELEPFGIKIVVRDPNFNTQAAAQAFSTLITEKPDVIIVQNPDVTTYAKLINQAEKAGIHVLQINMASNTKSAAFIGGDFVEMGEVQAQAIVNACKGKSGKVAIVQGPLSASASSYTVKGIENIFSKHPEIKVVSSQAADWDATKAKAITQTVLKQNPDLCGVIGFWDGMDIGTAAAIKEAGLTGKVFLATSGGGEQTTMCEPVKAGAYDLDVQYNVPNQAASMASTIKFLLSSGVKPGTVKGAMYTTLVPVTKANASLEGTCWTLKK